LLEGAMRRHDFLDYWARERPGAEFVFGGGRSLTFAKAAAAANRPQAAARATKELARSSFDTDFTTAYARSRELVQQCLDTADVADARAAWLRRHK
jgi:enoyl-CoA hydratase/carnithine racemase